MAISTYAELQTAVANWVARADLTSHVPEFISLAEAKIARRVRCAENLTKDSAFSITGEYVATPTGFLEVSGWYLNDSTKTPVRQMSIEQQGLHFGANTGSPKYYCVEGSNLRFAPIPDGTYSSTLLYYKRFTAMATAASNDPVFTVLATYPDIWLYGSLLEAAPFLENDPRIQTWSQLFASALAEQNAYELRRQWNGPALTVRAC
jgi:hypothetical protein